MPARALATGTVSFGLVSIPIKLYSATEPGAAISFNMLHKEDGSRLKQQYVCAKDGKIVGRDDMVKGYEFAKDQYVTFTPEELKELEEKSTQVIEITEFVPAKTVDPVYYDKPYFLGPDKGGDKAYKLLAKAMRESGRVALAKYGARGKGYLVMLRPTDDDRLVMQQLHYANEVRSAKEVPVGETHVRDQELNLAKQLIDQITSDTFNPEAYEDDVRKRILDVIERKVEGKEVKISPVEEPRAQVIDLMEALKASLAKRGQKAAGSAAERKPARRAPREESAREERPREERKVRAKAAKQ